MRFFAENSRWLLAGMLIAFSSGYGQTFFISIFAGGIRDEFGLSHGTWGGTYTLGTLLSAAVMLWAGGLVDKYDIKTMATCAILGLAVVCLAMSVNTLSAALVPIIFGLRLFGQGLLGHIATVAMGRWFAKNRGRAVAIAGLGFSTAEAALPVLFVAIMAGSSWRGGWFAAGIAGVAMIPLIWMTLAKERSPRGIAEVTDTVGMNGRHWTRREAASHWLFWATMPAFIGPPMFSTALFFQQVHLAEVKGWPLASFVSLIPVSTTATIITMLVTGWLVDRVGSRRLVPLFPLPFVLSFTLMGQAETLVFAACAFAFHGMGQGMISALNGTFWPEFYGTRHLGSVRATAVSVMVLGSAIGPGITGWLIDAGIDFDRQMIWIAAYMAVSALIALIAISRVTALPVSA